MIWASRFVACSFHSLAPRVGLSAPSPSRLVLRFHGVLALRAALVGSHFVASVVPLLSLSLVAQYYV
jgi:hypothetical protein